MSTTVRPATLAVAALGTAVTATLAYAIYFDHKRRTDVEFRKDLRRDAKRQARAAKFEAQEAGNKERNELRQMVDEANEEGYPEKAEDKEQYFMSRLSEGEGLSASESSYKEAALCLFRALQVYPQPKELMNLYDKTVPKPVLDMLAEMVAYDRHTRSSNSSSASSAAGVE